MGVPMINAIYEDTPMIGAYTLPLLVWHPMELVIGSILAPRLHAWVNSEKERLRKTGDAVDGDDVGEEEEDPTEHMDVENQNQQAEEEEKEQSATLALQSMMSVTFYQSSSTATDLEEASN